MAVYTFYLHEAPDVVPTFEIQLFDAIDPALAYGQRLLKERARYTFVDITCNDDSVAKLVRDAL